MGPGSWQLGKVVYDTDQSLVDLMEKELENLSSATDVTAWMDFSRTCRHPQVLWAIDYILPSPHLDRINDLIRSSEKILYGDKRNLSLINDRVADLYQEIAFHTIRAHLRAEEGDIETSISIFEELSTLWIDKLTLIRKSNLLVHACLAFLCNRNWDKSYECLQKHWSILKYAEIGERDELGLWDNEIIIRQIYWFFMQNSYEFRSFYATKIGSSSSSLWRHKKIGLLYLQSNDHSWVVSFCGLAFYNHARKLMPELPEYQIKNSTPTNIKNIAFYDIPCSKEITNEKLYLQNYQELSQKDSRGIDYDKLNDYLFSYLSFKENRVRNFNKIVKLFILMDRESGVSVLDNAKSILDLGCGLTIMQSKKVSAARYLGVDVSTEICNQLKKNNFNCIHSSIPSFVQSSQSHFDICIASSVLELLNIHQVHNTLEFLRDSCSEVGIIISIGENSCDSTMPRIGTDEWINESTDFWKNLINEYLTGVYDSDDDLLCFYGHKK